MRNETSSLPTLFNIRKDWYQDFVVVPILLGVLLILGHYGLLTGETFFADADAVINFDHNKNNELSKGWRPDVALGLTYFFGDILWRLGLGETRFNRCKATIN